MLSTGCDFSAFQETQTGMCIHEILVFACLCVFVCKRACADPLSRENPKRRPKTASFQHFRDTRNTSIPCIVIITSIICKFMCIIINIYMHNTSILVLILVFRVRGG